LDKQTGRVLALILLLIVVGAALRGYLPATGRGAQGEPISNRAALTLVVVALAGTMALLTVAIIARLRDPVQTAPSAADISDMLGTGRGRPSWRVLLIGIAVIVVWLLIAMMLARVWTPSQAASPPQNPTPSAAPSARPPAAQPPRRPDESGDMLGILLLTTLPMMLVVVAGSVVMSRRRRRRADAPGEFVDDHDEFAAAPTRSPSLVRAAQRGLAEMTDLSREPREAIIACYAAMEAELAHVPGAVPQEFDTPTEVLARAIDRHALRADNAIRLVDLFAEARFSPHVMNEGHRDAAVGVLRLVLDELGERRTV
jgi:Domain of unknown function (DUF4129)